MRILFAALAAAFLAAPALASDQDDAMATVKQFIDGFNSGDVDSAIAACAPETDIIDDFAPYLWDGEGACDAWVNDYDVWAKANGVSGGVVTAKTPKHVDVVGDDAYVVLPVSYEYMMKGKKVSEPNSLLTVVLQRSDEGWRIAGWAWSKD